MNTEIGKELWITQNSVKQALKRMFRKLKVATRMEIGVNSIEVEMYPTKINNLTQSASRIL